MQFHSEAFIFYTLVLVMAYSENGNFPTPMRTSLLPRAAQDFHQSLLILPRAPPKDKRRPRPARAESSSASDKTHSSSDRLTTSSSSDGRWDPEQYESDSASQEAKVKAHGPAKIRTRVANFSHKTSELVDSRQTRKRKVKDPNQAEVAVQTLRGGHGEVKADGLEQKIDVDTTRSKLGAWVKTVYYESDPEVTAIPPGERRREIHGSGKSQVVVEGKAKAKITSTNIAP